MNSFDAAFAFRTQFAAEVPDVYVHSAGLAFVLVTPDLLEEHFLVMTLPTFCMKMWSRSNSLRVNSTS